MRALRAVTEGAQALTPPGVAAADAAGTGPAQIEMQVSKSRARCSTPSGDLARRFHGLPVGAGAYIVLDRGHVGRLDAAEADRALVPSGRPATLARAAASARRRREADRRWGRRRD